MNKIVKKYLNKIFKVKIDKTITKVIITDIWINNKEILLWLKFIPDICITQTTNENISIYHRSGWKTVEYLNIHKSKIKKMAKYTLLDIKAPEQCIDGNGKTFMNDPGVGGIKLVYSKSKEYSLTGETKKVIFLKPYKEIWEPRGRKFCKKSEWGNTSSPFTNIWLEIYEDYTNYEKEIEKVGFIQHERITDISLIKHLNAKSTSFSINEPNDKITTHLGIKIVIWVNENIIIPIKERIFINNQK